MDNRIEGTWSAPNGMLYGETGNPLNIPGNCRIMFAGIEGREFMLDDHQVKFVNSVRNYFDGRGYVADKQFRYISAYYGVAAGCGDIAEDPGS